MDKEETKKYYEKIRERGYSPLKTFPDGRIACVWEGVGYIYVPHPDKFLDTRDK